MRRALGFGLTSVCIIAATVVACGDDDDNNSIPGTDAGGDTSKPVSDSSVPDTSTGDSGGGTDASDSGVDAEAGPTTTVTLSSAGWIRVFQDAVFGEFLVDQTVVRVSNAPECVAHIGSKGKLFAQAGTLTVGGQIVNSDGGPTQNIEVQPGPLDDTGYPYAYFAFLDGISVFPPDDSLTLQLQTGGTATVGAMPVQTLRPPPAAQVTVTAPAIPDGGALNIPSTLPFNVTWTAPDAGADQRLFIGIIDLIAAQKEANVFCGYPLSAGKATVPANFLAEVRSRLGAATTGKIHIWVGGQKEVVVGSDSVVIEVTRPDSTNFLTPSVEEPQVQLQ